MRLAFLKRPVFLVPLAYVVGVLTPFSFSALGDYVIDPWVRSSFGRDELIRTTSPDGVVDAVMEEVNPGAFSSYIYNVYVVPKGGKLEGQAMLSGSHFDGWKLRWKEPHLLDLEYLSGHISGYNSNWSSQQVKNGDYRVELRLTPLTDGFLVLKPGGEFR